MGTSVTIYDVAARAGVSEATVSRVLNRQTSVRPATAQRVLDAAAELGYVRNVSATSLAKKGSDFVGLLLRDPRNPSYAELSFGLQRECARIGLQVVTVSPSAIRGEGFELEGMTTLLGLKPQGLFVATGTIDLEQVAAIAPTMPTVVLPRPVTDPQISSVSFNEEAGMVTIAKEVIARGHRSVALLGTDTRQSRVEHFRLGVLQRELEAAGVKVIRHENSDRARLDTELESLLDRCIASGITALLCTNDVKAMAALSACTRRGISVPDQLSVTGADGASLAVETLGISTIRWPLGEAAALATQALSSMIAGGNSLREKHLVNGEFIAGRTLASLL